MTARREISQVASGRMTDYGDNVVRQTVVDTWHSSREGTATYS